MTSGTNWIDQAQRLVEALRAPSSTVTPADATTEDRHAADCRWCPVCQVASVVRGERPEVTAALADLLTTAAAALHTVAAAGTPERPTTEAAPDESEPPPPVQRIDIA
jgi:hypothetical protein